MNAASTAFRAALVALALIGWLGLDGINDTFTDGRAVTIARY